MAADALSRRREDDTCQALSLPQLEGLDDLDSDLSKDLEINRIVNSLKEGTANLEGYHLEGDKLLYHGRRVLPRASPWIPKLFHEFHNSAVGGHSGILKTYQRMAAEFYWVGMRKEIAKMVSECEVCQRNKYSTLLPSGLLQPLELPEKVWDEVTMDFIDGLPKSEGYSVILVVVDRLSKYAHFVPLRHPYTAATVAAAFLREVVRLHGIPKAIVTDRDKVFLSIFWKELFRMQGTTLKRSTAYHPQTDGQTEVVNRCLETYLRCFASDAPKQWSRWLSWAEYWYNTSYHTASHTTPFNILYGRDPPRLVHQDRFETPSGEVDRYLEERDQVLKELKTQLLRAQQTMKARADLKRKEVHFDVGEMVFLKLRPYRQQSVAQRRNEKLAPKYYGPFEIIAKVGQVAYKLKLPQSSSIHPVFHVSQLKKYIGDSLVESVLPQNVGQGEAEGVQPEVIRKVRTRGKSDRAEWEVLVQWKGLPAFEATWESYEGMRKQFPDFHLEDKVNVLGEGIDTNSDQNRFGTVYQRRNGPKART